MLGILKQNLNRLTPGLHFIYKRHFANKLSANPLSPIYYTPLQSKISTEDMGRISQIINRNKSTILNLKEAKVLQVATEDIEISDDDKFGSIILASEGGFRVRYGDYGIMPSSLIKPLDLLNKDLEIKEQFGVLNIRKHIPFLIEAKNPDQCLALNMAELSEVYDYEINKSRFSLNVVCELKPEQAKQMSLALQNKIFYDKSNEYFYEEVTSKVYKPTIYNKSSGTLMNFANNDPMQDNKTASHYHPGERSLIIITTNKPSGVTLNFCGVAENPEHRKDCEQYVEFPKNSMLALNFPPYTHHKFHGEFDCLSIHPREGANLIEAVQSGTLPKGFLESATVFSKTDKDSEKWDISKPNQTNQYQTNQSKETVR